MGDHGARENGDPVDIRRTEPSTCELEEPFALRNEAVVA